MVVEGRQILDAILIANEVIDLRLRSGEQGVICKLHIVKAFDHVNWNFLLYPLKIMGLGDKWRERILRCTSTFHSLFWSMDARFFFLPLQ